MSITGGCLCGAVSYEISGSFLAAGHCHCSVCRRAHGAAYATWAFVNPDEFRWTSGTEQREGYASSPALVRQFCKRCGSPLAASQGGKVVEVVLASVHGDPGVRPQEHVFVGSKAIWDEITDALPQHQAWPPGMGS